MKTSDTIPRAPGALPVVGHAAALLRDPFTFLRSLTTHDGLATVRLGPLNVVVVCDPKLTHDVLVDDRTFDKGGPILERFNEPLGDGLASCPHSRHRKQRRLIQPVFHSSRMPGYAREMSAQITDLVGAWRPGEDLDLVSEMMTLAVRIAIATMFSDSLSQRAMEDASEDLRTVDKGMYRRAMLPRRLAALPTPGNRRYLRALDRIRRTVGAVVADRERDNVDHGDLMSALMTASDSGERLSRTEIVDQAMTFFLGGTVAYGSTMSWAMYLIATHPEVERQLFEEVDSVLAGETPGPEHLPRLDLTRRIVTETVRLHPPGWLLSRITTADTSLGGHRIPAGTNVFYSPFLIHHRGDLYPDPEAFDPHRWSSERLAPARDAFIAFSGGARKCIGEQFGYLESVLTLAAVASKWRLRLAEERLVRPARAIVAVPRKLTVRATPRTRAWVRADTAS